MTPASQRQIAVELEKLRAVFGYEEGAWKTAAGLYLDALADIPLDLLMGAVQTCIRHGEDRFPKPRQLRDLVADSLKLRHDQLAAETSRARPQSAEDRERYFAEQRDRDEAIAARRAAYAEARAWREAGRPMLPQGMTIAAWQVAGSPDTVNGWPVWGKRRAPNSGLVQAAQAALGLTATPARPHHVVDEVPVTIAGQPWREEADATRAAAEPA